jgi:hypothetical protein
MSLPSAVQAGWDVLGGYLSPVNDAYWKRALAPGRQRLRMCQLATADSGAGARAQAPVVLPPRLPTAAGGAAAAGHGLRGRGSRPWGCCLCYVAGTLLNIRGTGGAYLPTRLYPAALLAPGQPPKE